MNFFFLLFQTHLQFNLVTPPTALNFNDISSSERPRLKYIVNTSCSLTASSDLYFCDSLHAKRTAENTDKVWIFARDH